MRTISLCCWSAKPRAVTTGVGASHWLAVGAFLRRLDGYSELINLGRLHFERLTDRPHGSQPRNALAIFDQIHGAERDAGSCRKVALAQQPLPAQCCERRHGHLPENR